MTQVGLAQYRCRMRGSATAGTPRSRRLAIIAANPRGAVYGTIVFLLLGALGLFDEGLAVRLALWNGVVQLVGWGIDVGRRRGQAWPAALLTGLVNGPSAWSSSCWRCCCTDH